MNYENYEEYMKNILGYVPNTYYGDDYQSYNSQQYDQRQEEIELYPEIYKIIYPMIRKACDDSQGQDITRDVVENVTNIVYTNIEGDIDVSGNQSQTIQPELRNGDVINPRAKTQPQRETRSPRTNNPLLRDLIRILVLREFFDRRPNRAHFPSRPRPPFGSGMQPPPRIY